jgi:hypothetical protein
MERMDDKLQPIWQEYRDAFPDRDAGADFMPNMWAKIEARRNQATLSFFRHWVEACIMATVALTVLMSAFLIPRYQRQPVYQSTYVDVLAAADSNSDAMEEAILLPISRREPR